jgi:phosphoglucosamine mutase
VIDCANGAAYQTAPSALWELGAEVTSLGVSPNGLNINEGCGSTDTALISRTVVETGADIGLALDGDADRLIVVDEKGRVIDGDQMMALIGASWHRKGLLRGGGVVATIMSNLGLERYFQDLGPDAGAHQGGRPLRARDDAREGLQRRRRAIRPHDPDRLRDDRDGLVAGLQVLAELVVSGKPASEMLRQFEPLPQLLKNVRFKGKSPLDKETVQAAIAAARRG